MTVYAYSSFAQWRIKSRHASYLHKMNFANAVIIEGEPSASQPRVSSSAVACSMRPPTAGSR